MLVRQPDWLCTSVGVPAQVIVVYHGPQQTLSDRAVFVSGFSTGTHQFQTFIVGDGLKGKIEFEPSIRYGIKFSGSLFSSDRLFLGTTGLALAQMLTRQSAERRTWHPCMEPGISGQIHVVAKQEVFTTSAQGVTQYFGHILEVRKTKQVTCKERQVFFTDWSNRHGLGAQQFGGVLHRLVWGKRRASSPRKPKRPGVAVGALSTGLSKRPSSSRANAVSPISVGILLQSWGFLGRGS